MKQSGKVQRVRLGLHLAGAGWLLLAACTSATSPAPATQGATMEAKESAAMAENKEGAMEPATAPMESAGMAENKEGAMEPATMEKEGAMEAAMAATENAAMMEKEEGAMEPAAGAMESAAGGSKTQGTPDAAMMDKTDEMMTDQKEGEAMRTQASAPPRKLPDQRLSPHFVVSSPKHGETLTKAPERIQINFDFTLHESSAIAVTRDGAPVQIGAIPVNPRGLVLAATLPQAGDGLYVVGYKACWPDRSCHDGQFAFTVQP